MTKVRQSNIELLRIISMLLVLIIHANFVSIGCPNIDDIEASPTSSFLRILVQSLSLVCVNLFVLISGYFGINPKLKSISNLIFQIVFFRIIALLFILGIGISHISMSQISCIIPGCGDWFVMSYLLLILFSPLINSYISNVKSKQLLIYIIIFYAIQSFFGWFAIIKGREFHYGYSVISMIGLYLIGRYLNLHGSNLRKIPTKHLIGGYILTSTLSAILMFFALKFISYPFLLDYTSKLFGAYLSPFVVLSSVCLFLFFLRLDFNSKFINWIAVSSFSVYLIHCNPYTFSYYCDFCANLFKQYNTLHYLVLITLFIISVFVIAILIDKIRILAWNAIVKFIQHKFPQCKMQ